AAFLVVFLAAVFLAAVFFAVVFLAAVFFASVFFAVVFLAAVFFAAVFLAAVFFAGALAAAFLVAALRVVFLAAFLAGPADTPRLTAGPSAGSRCAPETTALNWAPGRKAGTTVGLRSEERRVGKEREERREW